MTANRFVNRVAVVTGGGRGLGLDIARGFVSEGARVAIIGRDAATLAAAASELSSTGPGEAHAYPADVAEDTALSAAAQAILTDLGAPDVLVNNAGINPWYRKAQDTPMAEWRAVVEVNLTAVFHCCQLFGRAMLERRAGSIVNISSVAGHVGIARTAAYNAAKGGLELLTKSLAIDWAEANVRVNTVAPGYVETDLTSGLLANEKLSTKVLDHTPMRRLAAMQEITSACLYLASSDASYITGQCLRVDGGYTAC